MPRYIDANKIKLTGLTFEDINNEVYFSLSDVRKAIEQTPTADVVEVVRCKDCVKSECWYADKRRCFLWSEEGIAVFEDGFCSYGKRKEQG